jgi:hypothetical protein
MAVRHTSIIEACGEKEGGREGGREGGMEGDERGVLRGEEKKRLDLLLTCIYAGLTKKNEQEAEGEEE